MWCKLKMIVQVNVTSLQRTHAKFRQYLNHLKALSKTYHSKVYKQPKGWKTYKKSLKELFMN